MSVKPTTREVLMAILFNVRVNESMDMELVQKVLLSAHAGEWDGKCLAAQLGDVSVATVKQLLHEGTDVIIVGTDMHPELAGIPFPGHLNFSIDYSGMDDVEMMDDLFSEKISLIDFHFGITDNTSEMAASMAGATA